MTVNSPIAEVVKITKPQIAALKKLGLNTVQDILLHFPYRYLDFSKTVNIREIIPGENITIRATIKQIQTRFSFRSHMSIAEAIVSDQTGSLKILWFNQGYIAKQLAKGEEIYLSGTPDYYNSSLQLANPLYEKVSEFPIHTARLVPVYHLTEGIYPKTFRNLIAKILNFSAQVTETLPEKVLENQSLINIEKTIIYSHFPENDQQIAEAKKRLAFEEIFLNQLAAQRYKILLEKKPSYKIPFDQKLIKSFVNSLPFKLTAEQKKAAWDVLQDLEKTSPMNRLIEGDVGSGKTLVALIAALQTAEKQLQVAFLTPTEILANQHYQTIQKYFSNSQKPQHWHYGLLTSKISNLDGEKIIKNRLQNLIQEGMPGIYVGTHALIAKKTTFKKLALVIIDEQHRFGVQQRAELLKTKKIPHLMSLTATPIPRTMQLAYFGELDISRIQTKPAGRKPIITKIIPPSQRNIAYQQISSEIKKGRQAFVITPIIEERAGSEAKAAKGEFEKLKQIFPEFTIGLLHGKMKSSDKENIMAKFLANEINILIATSVVEVGVDIPNASIMMIEDSERFGLAQLHQFRGRVGRSEHQSFCLVMSQSQNLDSLQRLQIFSGTENGFVLAEADLKQRGFGQIYGAEQTGWNFKYFSSTYISLIQPARQEARELLKNDINLTNFPILWDKIKDKIIHFE